MAYKLATPAGGGLATVDRSFSASSFPQLPFTADITITYMQASCHTSKVCPYSSCLLSHTRNALPNMEGYVIDPPIRLDSPHPPTLVSAPDRRIVAVGDLHGDIGQCRRALTLAGVLSKDGKDSWIGGNAVLVQVGDVLDRGGDEIAILSLLRWLNNQAQLKGGAVFQVNGNHETMNVEGDFRYVDPSGFYEANNFVDFCEEEHGGNWQASFEDWFRVSKMRKTVHQMSFNWMPWNIIKMQKGVSARSLLFSPGGPLAQELSQHGVVLQVNDWLFAHGGVLPHHVKYGLQRMNKEVSQWMQGIQDDFTICPVKIPFVATRGFDSVVWSRHYSTETFDIKQEGIQICKVLKTALEAVGAKGLVVGHTPQTSGANSKCQGQVWRIDVGMSRGMLNANPEVLEIVNDEVKVLCTPSRGRFLGNEDLLQTGVRHFTAS